MAQRDGERGSPAATWRVGPNNPEDIGNSHSRFDTYENTVGCCRGCRGVGLGGRKVVAAGRNAEWSMTPLMPCHEVNNYDILNV